MTGWPVRLAAAAIATVALGSLCCATTAVGGNPSPGGSDASGALEWLEGGPTDPLDDVDGASGVGVRALSLFGSARCSGGPEQKCHGDGAGGLWLRFDVGGPGSERGDVGDVIGVPSTERPELWRVRPFDPERSYLMLKVAGDAGIDGDVMPVGNGPDPRIVSLVRAWIEAGAPTR